MDQRVIVASESEQTEARTSPNTLWNEGRVVGYSAYEIYVRQHMLEDPNTPPASEREWLAASLASGMSILVKIDEDQAPVGENRFIDIRLPSNTQLCAANTIVGSLFYGEGVILGGTRCASSVSSYGGLIDKTSMLGQSQATQRPSGDCPPPSGDLPEISMLRKIRSYLHIFDGVVIQPGTWTTSADGNIDFLPELAKQSGVNAGIYPTVRLHVRGPIDDGFWLLLTGFTLRSIVSGESKYDEGSINTEHPQNGDYLGPETYPWANKIIFTVPSQAMTSPLFRTSIDNKQKQINDSPVIDMRHCDPISYYNSNHSKAQTTTKFDKVVTIQDGVALLTTYQRNDNFAPALFGALYYGYAADSSINGQENIKLNPIDTVAPRTIKLFHGADSENASDFEKAIPYNFALIRRGDDYVLEQVQWKEYKTDGTPNFTKGCNIVPVSDAVVTESDHQYHLEHKHGTSPVVKAVALTKDDGTLLPQDGTHDTVEHDEITWKILLDALGLNDTIDVLGDGLREFKKLIVNIFNGNNIKDQDEQYVIKVIRRDDGKYYITFEALDIPPAVELSVVKQDSKYYSLNAITEDTGEDSPYRAISLTNANRERLPLTGEAGDIDVTNVGKFNWQQLLEALGNNKTIEVLSDLLLKLQTELNTKENGKTYLINKDKNGNITLAPPEDVNIPEFPAHILEGIKMDVYKDTKTKDSWVGNLVLDVFGYVSTHGSGNTAFKAFNTFTTLTHTRGDMDVSAHVKWSDNEHKGLVQRFTVSTESLSGWARVCDKLREAGNLIYDAADTENSSAKVIFTCGGRPIYNSYSTSASKRRQEICAPDKMISVVAYIQPIRVVESTNKRGETTYTYYKLRTSQNENEETTVNSNNPVRGLLMLVDAHGVIGWKGSPSGGSYVGSLVGDGENQNWVPDFWGFTPGWGG